MLKTGKIGFFGIFAGLFAAACAWAIEADMLDERIPLRVVSDLPGFTVKTAHVLTGTQPEIAVRVRPERFVRDWRVVNFWGETVASGKIPADAANFSVPQLPCGHYTLTVEHDGRLYRRTVFSVVGEIPPPLKKPSPFGAGTHYGNLCVHAEFAAVIRAAGIQQLRDSFGWNQAEPAKGTINPSNSSVQALKRIGEGFDLLFPCCYGNRNYDGYSSPHTPEGIAAWKKYITWVPTYFPNIKEMEIWNEFNCAFLLRGVVAPTPENYLKLSKESYEAIKAACPDMPVVGCATSMIPWTWLERYFQLGGLKYLDVVSVHPYRWGVWWTPPETLYEDMKKLRTLIDKYAEGRKIPIYADEFGWPCGQEWGVSPEMQAVYLPRSFGSLLRAGVERGYWFKLIRHANQYEQWQVVQQSNSNCYLPDPAYGTFAAMTRILRDADFPEDVPGIAPALGLRFPKEGGDIRQLWSPGAPCVIEIDADAPLEIADLFGAPRTLTPVDGKVYLLLGGTTVYLTGAVKGMRAGSDIALKSLSKAAYNSPMRVDFHAPAGFSLRMRGQEFAPGVLDMPGADKIGGSAVRGELVKEGKVCGVLFFEFEVAPQLEGVAMRLDPQGDLVVNFSNLLPEKPQKLVRVVGSVNGKPVDVRAPKKGRRVDLAPDIVMPAEREAEVTIPGIASGLEPFELTQIEMEFQFDRHSPVRMKAPVTYAPCVYRKRFTSIFRPEDWEKQPAIDLEKFGTQIRDYWGRHVCDQLATTKGKLWLSWNENELLLTACFDDEKHCMVSPAWNGDSIQFGIAPLRENRETTLEYLAYYNEEKDQSNIGPSCIPAGFDGHAITSAARRKFIRQDGKTIYMMAIPWEVLPFLKPEAGKPFRFSLLVNGSDGGARGGICWGGGIWATKGVNYPVCVFTKESSEEK